MATKEERVRARVQSMCAARPHVHQPRPSWLALTRAPARARSYNKQEADFATREEFYNYLEEREDISEPLIRSAYAAPPS